MYTNSQHARERGSTSLAMRENNQSHNEIPLRTHWASYNQTDIQKKTSVGKDTEKLEPSHIAHMVEM